MFIPLKVPLEVTRQLQGIYGDHFPVEAREALAGWLETSFTEELEAGNPEHERHARDLVLAMVQQLEARAAEATDFAQREKLEHIVANLKVGQLRENSHQMREQ